MPPTFKGCCAHDHDCEAADCGPSWSLFKYIAVHQVRCLNEAVPDSCQNVFRPWSQRLEEPTQTLRSNEDDPELLLHIPFDGQVVLKAICIIGGSEGRSPSKLRAFVNRDNMDFVTANAATPVQEWDLLENPRGEIEYPTQVFKFNGVYSLDLHIPASFGADDSEVLFVGLKGDFTQVKRQAVEAVYEARPVPKDHKIPGMDQGPADSGIRQRH